MFCFNFRTVLPQKAVNCFKTSGIWPLGAESFHVEDFPAVLPVSDESVSTEAAFADESYTGLLNNTINSGGAVAMEDTRYKIQEILFHVG